MAARKQQFDLVFDPVVKRHLRNIATKYHGIIRSEIEKQLTFEPDTPTHNRKPLQPPGILKATWELRCGPMNRFRVLYSVESQQLEVQILAIGVKDRNRLLVGGEEIEL